MSFQQITEVFCVHYVTHSAFVSNCRRVWKWLIQAEFFWLKSVEAPRHQRNELVGAINPPFKASRESLIWNLAAIRNVEIVKLMFSRISGRDERLQ